MRIIQTVQKFLAFGVQVDAKWMQDRCIPNEELFEHSVYNVMRENNIKQLYENKRYQDLYIHILVNKP